MKLIHLSDIHLTIPGELVSGIDPHARLRLAFADIARHHSDAARVVITGDLAHWGERQAYEALAAIIADCPVPVRLLIGNHDDRATFLSVFPDQARDGNGDINHEEPSAAGRLIYCDTTMPRTHAGHFGPERRRWLAERLEAAAEGALLFFHHHPTPIHQIASDSICLVEEDRAPLAALVAAHRDRIRHIFFGHTHFTLSGTMMGVPYAGVRSTVTQGLPVFSGSPLLEGGDFEPYYAVVIVEADSTVIHQIPFAYDGPVRRFGTEWEDWAKPAKAG